MSSRQRQFIAKNLSEQCIFFYLFFFFVSAKQTQGKLKIKQYTPSNNDVARLPVYNMTNADINNGFDGTQ